MPSGDSDPAATQVPAWYMGSRDVGPIESEETDVVLKFDEAAITDGYVPPPLAPRRTRSPPREDSNKADWSEWDGDTPRSRSPKPPVRAVLGHAQDIAGSLKNKKITVQKNDKTGGKFVQRVEELSEQPQQLPRAATQPQRDDRESAGTDDEPTVLSVRCTTNQDASTFARTKKRIDLTKRDRSLTLDSAGDGSMPFEVTVKKTADPAWYHLTATVRQKNGQTEARGNQLRNTRINGKPARPDNE